MRNLEDVCGRGEKRALPRQAQQPPKEGSLREVNSSCTTPTAYVASQHAISHSSASLSVALSPAHTVSHLLCKVLSVPPQLPVISQLSRRLTIAAAVAAAAVSFLPTNSSTTPAFTTDTTTTAATDGNAAVLPRYVAGSPPPHEGYSKALPLPLHGAVRVIVPVSLSFLAAEWVEVQLRSVGLFLSLEQGTHHEELAHAAAAEYLEHLDKKEREIEREKQASRQADKQSRTCYDIIAAPRHTTSAITQHTKRFTFWNGLVYFRNEERSRVEQTRKTNAGRPRMGR